MAQPTRHRGRSSHQHSQPDIGLREYVEILFRQKWLFLIPVVIVGIVVTLFAGSLPKIYQANTLVFIQMPSVNNPVGPSDTVRMVEDQLRTIQEEITSFRFLSEVIDNLPQISLTLNTEAEKEDYVNRMRANLTITTRGIDLFEIAYKDPIPELTQVIANKVTEIYIEGVLDRNTKKYDEGTQALEKEKGRFLQELQRIEGQITDFKELWKEYLIPQVSIKQQIWNQEAAIRSLNNTIASASREMNVLLDKLAETPNTIESKRSIERDPKYEIIEKELRTMELHLEELLLQFTDKHPQVKQLRDRIELRQNQLKELEDSFKTNIEESINPLYQSLQEAILNQEMKMQNYYGQKDSAETFLNELRLKETKVPQLEEKLRNLNRDYLIKQGAYDRVVKEIQSKEVQGRLADLGAQVKYEIIDSARTPRAPIEPNVGLISMAGVAAGVALGFALVFGREYFDHSLRSLEQARSSLNIPVLGAVPIIVTEEELRQSMKVRRRWIAIGIILGVILVVGLGIVGYLYRNEILFRLGF